MNRLLIIVILFYSVYSYAQNVSAREAINVSGQQRMLVFKTGKCHLAILRNIDQPEHQEELNFGIELFEQNLIDLKSYTPTTEIETALKEVSQLWIPYKAILKSEESQHESAEYIVSNSDALFKACNKVVTEYENYTNAINNASSDFQALAHIINISGRQRMFSQQLALHYLATKQKIKHADQNRAQTITEMFTAAIKDLTSSGITTEHIQQQLKEVQTRWMKLYGVLMLFDENSTESAQDVIADCDWILKKMDVITTMYQEIGLSLSISTALNRAGRQRMLTQRMAKCYAAIALKYNVPKHKRQLSETIDLFDEELLNLTTFAPTSNLQMSMKALSEKWISYKAELSSNYSKENIIKVLDKSDYILNDCQSIVDQIEAYALTSERYNELITKLEETATSDNVAHVINISGRQRMLSQRIALYFMMCAEDMGGSIAKVRLNSSLEKYALSLNELKNSQLNSDDIATQLKTIEDEWLQTNKTCESVSSNTKDEIINLLEQSEKMLAIMEKVTNMYEQKMETMLRSN